MSKVTTERRAHARFAHRVELESKPAEGKVARMVADNLSLGGLYCTSPVGYEEMTRLAVRLMLPSESAPGKTEPLDIEAVVVRRRELASATQDRRYELALFFPAVTEQQRRRLERYLLS